MDFDELLHLGVVGVGIFGNFSDFSEFFTDTPWQFDLVWQLRFSLVRIFVTLSCLGWFGS